MKTVSSFVSFVSYALVAIVSAGFSALITSGAITGGPAVAQPAPAATTPLLTQPLADLPGREVRMTLLDRPPGDSSPAHRHPGHHTFGYVVEGTYEIGVDGGAVRTLKAGETFYEPPGSVHSVSRNAGSTRMKVVVFMVADSRNPSTVPAQ